MTISAVPFALQNVPINADVVREAVSSLVANGGGVVQSGDFAVTQTGTPSMAVQVGVGRAWIAGNNLANLSGQAYSKQGMYYVMNDAPYTVTVNAADPTNPRIDTVYLAIQDSAYAGGTDAAVIAVATGTPSATPVAPTTPNNALSIANIAVAANASSITNANITSMAPTPLTLGRVIPVATKAARDALIPYAGMQVMRADRDNWIQTYNGSSWEYRQPPLRYLAPQGNYVNLTGTGSRQICSVTVPIKSYAQRAFIFGRSTVFCPTISTGTEELNLAVSLMQSGVATAQCKSKMVWTAGYSNINLTQVCEGSEIIIPSGTNPLARMWLESVNGSLSTTASAGTFADFYVDVRPDDD